MIRALMSVVLPTPGGPWTRTTKGGGSSSRPAAAATAAASEAVAAGAWIFACSFSAVRARWILARPREATVNARGLRARAAAGSWS